MALQLPPPFRAAAGHFARHADKDDARAAALSFAVVKEQDKRQPVLDGALLHEAFEKDSSILVQRAAVRIAGFLGDREGNLDLPAMLLRLEDAALLVDVIQARDLWSVDGSHSIDSQRFDLIDGFSCQWIDAGDLSAARRPWSAPEIARLEEILRQAKDSKLRDAASMALAGRWRASITDLKNPPPVARGLKAHEWGVFRDGGWRLQPADAARELPGFVSKSTASVRELAASRLDQQEGYNVSVFKPVIFFYAPEPVSLLVQVGFFEGRPWLSYPESTDHVLATRQVGFFAENASRPAEFSDRMGMSPPWITSSAEGPSIEGSNGQFQIAPWVHPGVRQIPLKIFGSTTTEVLAGLGLEWCGLRVGFEAALEAELQPVEAPAWWNALRQVPSTPVAVRGQREKFLFYDGAVSLPPPLFFCWKDDARRELLVAMRQNDAYVDRWDWPRDSTKKTSRVTRVPGVFIVEKKPGEPARGEFLEALSPNDPPVPVALGSLDLHGEALERRFHEALVREGLSEAEAKSLVDTWRREFFEADGARAITILPRWIYDFALPLHLAPRPEELVRVGLVWKELGGLPVGWSAYDADDPSSRWLAEPLETATVPVDVVEGQLPPLRSRKLVLGPEGKLTAMFGCGNERGASADLSRVLLSAGPAGGDPKKSVRFPYLADLKAELIFDLDLCDALGVEDAWPAYLSADGLRLAVMSRRNGKFFVQVIDLSGSKVFTLSAGTKSPQPVVLSGNGRCVAFSDEKDICVVDLAAKTARRIAVGNEYNHATQLSFDGGRVAYVAEVMEMPWAGAGGGEIYLVDLDLGTRLNVTRSRSPDWKPSLSADGRRIAFQSLRDRDEEVYLVDVEAHTIRNISDQDGEDGWPAVSGDGRRVAFAHDFQVQVFDVDSGCLVKVPGADHAWSPKLSQDGRKVLFERSGEREPQVYLRDAPAGDRP